MTPATTALLTIDLQNDFLHPEGAYGRAGQGADMIQGVQKRHGPVAAHPPVGRLHPDESAA